VQTRTRALGVLLCRGLNGSTLEQVLALDGSFVPRVTGTELVRLRSRTVYYVLRRMQEAAARLAGVTPAAW
jgi:cysteine desulfuration protein SufE